jgi:TonB family protein
MKSSLGISVVAHVTVLAAMILLFNAVPRMNLPERVYSVKILQPLAGARGKSEAQVVETPKEAPKSEAPKKEPPKKEPPKKEEKIPVPKKPETKKESEKPKEAPPKPEEKPIDVGVSGEQGTGIAVDAPVFPFSYYLAAIERKVSANWFSAVSEGSSSMTCVVYFRLRRDGSVEDARIEASSGNAYFDRAALRAVKSSSPFPPLPRAFPEQYLGIHFTFVQKE